jgi:hypothetical protein
MLTCNADNCHGAVGNTAWAPVDQQIVFRILLQPSRTNNNDNYNRHSDIASALASKTTMVGELVPKFGSEGQAQPLRLIP